MSNDEKEGVDPKEKQQDEEALKTVSDEDRSSQVVEKYGLDAEEDSELIAKIVESDKEGHEILSTAIGQKINWREQAQKPKEEIKPGGEKPEEKPQPSAPETDVGKLVKEGFEERDLISLDLSDEIQEEIKAYATAKGVSILEASKSEFIGFLKTKEEEKEREEESSASKKGGGTQSKRDFSKLADEDIAGLDDDEFDEYKEWLKAQE